jgi:4-hydroxybenzoate polyprenyltransferase
VSGSILNGVKLAAGSLPAASVAGKTGLLRMHALSLWNRVKRGEGQLLAINVSLAIASRPSLEKALLLGAFSTVVLVVLYFLNDVLDAPRDRHDRGKDQDHVEALLGRRPFLLKLLAFEHVLLPALAWALFGWLSALGTALVLLVNAAYSLSLKGRAYLDVPWVAVWGALYALSTGLTYPFVVYASVGLMTGITHVFQITRDRDVDTLNAVRTSAVASRFLPSAELALCCVGLALCLRSVLGDLAGVSALAPLVLHALVRSNQDAWLLSKGYLGLMWLLLLVHSHGA